VIGGSGSQEACGQRPAGGSKVAVALGSQKGSPKNNQLISSLLQVFLF
jgi:hypothetical protein